MMEKEIEILNNIIKTHNQFSNDSELWKTVSSVLNVSSDEAKKLDNEYCNVISFYALCFAVGYITISFNEFLTVEINSGDIRRDGFIKIGKDKLLRKYGIDFSLEYFDTMKNLEDGFYQMKIKSGKGWHFIACYCIDGNLYVSCTGKRGIGVPASAVIGKEFQWLLRIA